MERMKCRHKAVLEDGLPNIYVQVGPKAHRGSGFDGCIICLDMGIAYNEQGLESARASMTALLEGIALGNDPEGGLYQLDRDEAQRKTLEATE